VIKVAECPVLDRHAAIAATVLDVETLVAAVVGAKLALPVAMPALVLDETLSLIAAIVHAVRLVAAVTAFVLDEALVATAALGTLRLLAAVAAFRLEVGEARLISAAVTLDLLRAAGLRLHLAATTAATLGLLAPAATLLLGGKVPASTAATTLRLLATTAATLGLLPTAAATGLLTAAAVAAATAARLLFATMAAARLRCCWDGDCKCRDASSQDELPHREISSSIPEETALLRSRSTCREVEA
jgi:hypothetical protein